MNMTNAAYHADPRIGSSSLKRILTSPDHCKNAIPGDELKFAFGTAAHTMTLEPDSNFIVLPEFELSSNAGKESAIDWIASNGGPLLEVPAGGLRKLTAADIRRASLEIEGAMQAKDYDKARWVADSVWSSHRAAQLLTGAIIEQSYFYRDLKARPDAHKMNLMPDLKTAACASEHAFKQQAEKLNYGFSMATYEHVLARQPVPILIDHWFWVVVETTADRERDGHPVFPVEVYEADEQLMTHSREQFLTALEIYRKCKIDNNWPAPPEPATATMLGRPGWAD